MSYSATWGVVPRGAILKIPRRRGADYLSGSVIQRKSLICGVHVATGKRVLARISSPEAAWKIVSLPSSSVAVPDRSTEWVTTATATVTVTYGWWSEEFARMRSTKLRLTHKKGRTSQLAKLLKELADVNVPVPKQPDDGDIDEVAITFLTHEIREITSRMRDRTKRVVGLAREYSAKWNSRR